MVDIVVIADGDGPLLRLKGMDKLLEGNNR